MDEPEIQIGYSLDEWMESHRLLAEALRNCQPTLEDIAKSLASIAESQHQIANDDPLSRIERALARTPGDEMSDAPKGDDALWERGF